MTPEQTRANLVTTYLTDLAAAGHAREAVGIVISDWDLVGEFRRAEHLTVAYDEGKKLIAVIDPSAERAIALCKYSSFNNEARAAAVQAATRSEIPGHIVTALEAQLVGNDPEGKLWDKWAELGEGLGLQASDVAELFEEDDDIDEDEEEEDDEDDKTDRRGHHEIESSER